MALFDRQGAFLQEGQDFCIDQQASALLRLRPAVPSVTGSPEELADEMRAYAALGVSHVQLYANPRTVAGIETLVPMPDLLDNG